MKPLGMKLKPCPFCGGAAELHSMSTDFLKPGLSVIGGEVGCVKCCIHTNWEGTEARATFDGYVRRGKIPQPRNRIGCQRALTLKELENLAYLRRKMGR